MSLRESRLPSLKDKLEAQRRDTEAELAAITKAETRAAKEARAEKTPSAKKPRSAKTKAPKKGD